MANSRPRRWGFRDPVARAAAASGFCLISDLAHLVRWHAACVRRARGGYIAHQNRRSVVAQNDAAQRARLRKAIGRYVHRFPRAADTAKGIVTRWLPCTGFECAPDHIDEVLVQMVSEGLLQALLLPDGRTLFRACGRA